jgi:hypothetical protein
LKRGTFFALENEGRAEPGFLVFLPEKPAIYLQYRRGQGGPVAQASTLRMRVSSAVAELGGTILVATLDDVLHSLRLEDVWMWRGEVVVGKKTYMDRRAYLKQFVEYHWIPDARLLGGIFTTVAQPMSMEKFSEKRVWDSCHSVEFIPDMPGKRRMIWYLEAQVKAAEAHAGLKQYREPVAPVPVAKSVAHPLAEDGSPIPVSIEGDATRKARAVPVDKMPDVYDLFGEDGFPISRASVQQFKLSFVLREAASKGELWVMARWRSEFGGYEIASLA